MKNDPVKIGIDIVRSTVPRKTLPALTLCSTLLEKCPLGSFSMVYCLPCSIAHEAVLNNHQEKGTLD